MIYLTKEFYTYLHSRERNFKGFSIDRTYFMIANSVNQSYFNSHPALKMILENIEKSLE